MKISWDDIKYIFQIPLEWYKTIHDRVFNAYGSNFIRVSDGYYDGLEIGIDFDEFSDSVNSCISGYVRTVDNISADEDGNVELSGYVKSVDHISADSSGNINLSSYVKSVNNISADSRGNVNLSGYVKSVDNISADSRGNVNLSGFVKSVNEETPNASGAVEINVGVKTINSNPPDTNGNINITVSADTSDCLKIADWMNVNSTHSVSPYYYANLAYTGNLPAGVTNLYSWVGAFTYTTLDDEITDLGYVKNTALTNYVEYGDLTDYVQFTDLTSYAQLTDLNNYALTSDLGELAWLNEDDLGDLAYMDSVTVDGHASNANGEVSFGLAGSKWVKTDASGHLTTTNEEPIAIDTSQYTPVNVSNQKVVTDVTWTGTKLQYKYQNWTFVNGVLVSRSSEATYDIDTPTVITWA